MKKIVLFLGMLVFSKSAIAISNQELATNCFEVGKAKINTQAQVLGCDANLEQIEVQGIDNRFFNPSKYVWYQVVAQCNGYDHVIVAMVQYHREQCF